MKVASGGSIPLVNALHTAVPTAEILLLGATDGFSNIHAPNERVLLDEFKKTVIAEATLTDEAIQLDTARSSRPSPSKSAPTTPLGTCPTAKVVGELVNDPLPSPSEMVSSLARAPAVARSSRPSPLKSPASMPVG